MEYSRIKGDNSGFLALLSLVFTLVIICIISYLALKVYFRKPVADEGMGEGASLSGQVVIPSNYQSILSSTRNKIDDINKKHLDELDQSPIH